ncbi:MAG: hypothetical protein K8R88_15845 [Armatimonadetes bacterium]|nr:hypothetical protein [Armatimonadota bacterium]
MLFAAGIAAGTLVYGAIRFGPDLMTAMRLGVFEKTEKHAYTGDSMANLKAQYTALMLYQDSEGQFPIASGWMDAISRSLNTQDLKEGEAEKKLHRPGLGAGEFGYAMNSIASGKYKGDVQAGTLLVFESSEVGRNANGDVSKLKSGPGISLEGTVVK